MNIDYYCIKYWGILVLLVVFFSCSEEQPGEQFEAVGDVYYISKLIENKKRTALAFYAYGNKAITSAEVTVPGGGTVSLNQSLNNSFTVYSEPNEMDFKSDYPVAGSYNFILKSTDGDNISSSDVLKIENLGIPSINEIRYEDSDFSYDLEWNSDAKAGAYLLKLFDAQNNLVFTSDAIEGTTDSYTLIENDLGTWKKQIVVGNTYTVQLISYLYETGSSAAGSGNPDSRDFNIQEVSIGEISFDWNQE